MNAIIKYKYWIYILPFLCFSIYYLYKAYFFLPHDFANYYFGAYFLENGRFPITIYEPIWFNEKIYELQENGFASYAPNTPFLALFFLPFTILNFSLAKLFFSGLSIVLFLYSIKRLFDEYQIQYIHIITILILFFIPIKNNILFGQVYLFLFFLISEGFLAYKHNRYIKMSLFWGIAILLKIFPVLFGVYLVYRKKTKAVLYLSIFCLLFFSISLLVNGLDSWLFFFKEIMPKASKGEISGEFIKNYQSILMLLKHLFVFNNTKNPNPLIDNTFLYSFLLLISKLIIIGYGILITLLEKSNLRVFSYWILATYLVSPYGSSYSSILLIFIFVYGISLKHKTKETLLLLVIILFISNFSPIYFAQLPIPFSFLKLFLFLLIWGFIFIQKIPNLKYHIYINSIALFISFIFLKLTYTNQDLFENEFLLEEQHQALIYDYKIEDGLLAYTYWTINGSKTNLTDFKISSINYEQVHLKKKQIYYKDIQITNSNSNKLKPAIVNGNTIIYLSDNQRGFGFYSFKKINLEN